MTWRCEQGPALELICWPQSYRRGHFELATPLDLIPLEGPVGFANTLLASKENVPHTPAKLPRRINVIPCKFILQSLPLPNPGL